MTPLPPPEAEEPPDYPYCDASGNITGPHNYQPAIDVLGGTGMWCICTQCGDYFRLDGTGIQSGAPTPPQPAAPSSGTTTPPPPSTSPPWLPSSS